MTQPQVDEAGRNDDAYQEALAGAAEGAEPERGDPSPEGSAGPAPALRKSNRWTDAEDAVVRANLGIWYEASSPDDQTRWAIIERVCEAGAGRTYDAVAGRMSQLRQQGPDGATEFREQVAAYVYDQLMGTAADCWRYNKALDGDELRQLALDVSEAVREGRVTS
jgi:hypothetical protein